MQPVAAGASGGPMAADGRAHIQLQLSWTLVAGLRQAWEKTSESRWLAPAPTRRVFRHVAMMGATDLVPSLVRCDGLGTRLSPSGALDACQAGNSIRPTGGRVGVLDPPEGSTVMPMPVALSIAPSIRVIWLLRSRSRSPAGRMVPLSLNQSS